MNKNPLDSQVIVLTGHYGSGKSEVAINLAIHKKSANAKTAVIDLDIANPYFRSRERQEMLSGLGVEMISNAYGYDITADLPALSPLINGCILNASCCSIVDVGGDDNGARILNQYSASLAESGASILFVANVFRPETDSVGKVIKMIRSIEKETDLKIDGMINNSNLLRATKPTHIIAGIDMLQSVSEMIEIPIVTTCCMQEHFESLAQRCDRVFPIKLFLRPDWLDR